MAHLTINVLGELEVFLDDVPVQSFESDKVRALLAYLVVEQTVLTAAKPWLDCCGQIAQKKPPDIRGEENAWTCIHINLELA